LLKPFELFTLNHDSIIRKETRTFSGTALGRLGHAVYSEEMKTYGYMMNSELNLAEAVQQKYAISDADIRKLIDLSIVETSAERECGIFMKQLQDTYRLSDKDRHQLASTINTLCYFPHRTVTDAVGADGTHGDHLVHESVIFKALQEHNQLPQGKPRYVPRRATPLLRDTLAEALKTKKKRKAS
jgi:hypothetical protein